MIIQVVDEFGVLLEWAAAESLHAPLVCNDRINNCFSVLMFYKIQGVIN